MKNPMFLKMLLTDPRMLKMSLAVLLGIAGSAILIYKLGWLCFIGLMLFMTGNNMGYKKENP